MSTPSRHPAGVPTGGQFAPSTHGEAGTSLAVDQPLFADLEVDGWTLSDAHRDGVVMQRDADGALICVGMGEDGGFGLYDRADTDPDAPPISEHDVDDPVGDETFEAAARRTIARTLNELPLDPDSAAGEAVRHRAALAAAAAKTQAAMDEQAVVAARLLGAEVARFYPQAATIRVKYADADDEREGVTEVRLLDGDGKVIVDDYKVRDDMGPLRMPAPTGQAASDIDHALYSIPADSTSWLGASGATELTTTDDNLDGVQIYAVPVAGLRNLPETTSSD